MSRITLRSLVFVLCAGLVTGALAQDPGPAKPKEAPSYIIQTNDVISVLVWKDAALTREKVIVRPDGRISTPLIQDMQAAGLTPVQLKEKIEKQLKEYVDVPTVTVIVDSIQSYQIYMIGNVNSPGPLRSSTPLTVLQALATAGGLGQYADKSKVTIMHGDERVIFNYEDFIKGKPSTYNHVLVSGDLVYVP